MDRIKLGKKIKEARERLNYTQETLISELNTRISLKTLQRAEKGSEEVSSDTLMIITEFLSIEFSDDGYIAVPELSSISQLIKDLKLYKYEVVERDNFEVDELEAILEFANEIEKPAESFREEIEKEVALKKCFTLLENKNIKIYARIKEDSEIIDNRECGYGIYKDDYKIICLYLFKKSSNNRVITKKDGKTYIKVSDDNYSNLKRERILYGVTNILKNEHLYTEEELHDYLAKNPQVSTKTDDEFEDFPF